jgi:outer membrane lipoprotein-sorting protein
MMKKSVYTIFVVLAFNLFTNSVNAMCPEEQGFKIAQNMQAATEGWGDITSSMQMIIRAANGKENTMSLTSKILEVKGDGDKAMIIFDQPQTVAGTKLLSYSHIKQDDEQFLFVPKTGRMQRIAGKSRSGSFLGSQFSFEDLSSFKLQKYRYRFLREEACTQEQCSVLAIYPEYKGSGYSKMISWIDAQSRVQKVEYYDREDELLKTLTIKKYQKVNDKYWQPVNSEMVNAQNGKSTKLLITDIKMMTGLKASDFDKSLLK